MTVAEVYVIPGTELGTAPLFLYFPVNKLVWKMTGSQAQMLGFPPDPVQLLLFFTFHINIRIADVEHSREAHVAVSHVQGSPPDLWFQLHRYLPAQLGIDFYEDSW